MMRTNTTRAMLRLGLLLLLLAGAAVQVYAQEADYAVPEPWDALVNNVFFDTYITDAIRDVSMQTGVPILTDVTVGGFVTMDLFDVPLPDALRQLVLPGGYTVRWMDGYYIVGSATPGSPLFPVLSVTERVKLTHLNASELPNMLIPAFRDAVRVDPSTNSALVVGPPDLVARIVEDIKKLDVAPYQIRIDALVTEVSSVGRKNLGIDWSWEERAINDGLEIGFSNLVGTIGYSITGGIDRFLASLRSQVREGNAKILANPNIMALEGKQASRFIGKVNYYRIVTGSAESPATRLEAIEAGVTLDLLARVADDGTITLEITPSVADVQGLGADELPVIGRRRLSTTVRVKDGETIALGGLLQEMEMETTSQVPILGSLPIIGRLFSATRTQVDETEVLIFITPTIVRDAND